MDGDFPGMYAFNKNKGRSFRVKFGPTENEFSIVLFERTEKLSYEDCAARGLFTNIDNLATAIDLWAGQQKDISEIRYQFEELELYKGFEYIHPDNDIDRAWTKVKNRLFNNTEFWRHPEWEERYEVMLREAKKHKAFIEYFPFTSHYLLRFSLDQLIRETWPLDYYIIPVMYSEEVPETLGKFYVSYHWETKDGKFFDSVKEALDFYAEKLKENKPTRWVG